MKGIKSSLEYSVKKWRSIYITYKILFIISMLSFLLIIFSVFNPSLENMENLVIIRTIFSSIIGFLLEACTQNKMICNDKIMFFRNLVVGIMSITITIVVIICYIYIIDIDNGSLILLKDILFSCIGFLISASKNCAK